MNSALHIGERKPPFRATTSLRTVTLDSRTLIRMDSDYEVRFWCAEFACSFQELRRAVSAVGNSVERVCAYLEER